MAPRQLTMLIAVVVLTRDRDRRSVASKPPVRGRAGRAMEKNTIMMLINEPTPSEQ